MTDAPEGMKMHSDEAWEIASCYSWALASSTRDLASQIDVAIAKAREVGRLKGWAEAYEKCEDQGCGLL